ncbi:MAG: HEAT repeat domain-containing protein [Thermodesulfovibrionales bacterium]
MADDKTEKIPIDAKLLTDAVIELNISRRSVGMYPRDHPIVRESIQKAFGILNRLFEIRNSITLGIAKDVLIIDDYILDTRNPVFREFARSQYRKGIIAITFSSGLEIDELISLHELLVTGDEVIGQALLTMAGEKKLRHIKLVPIDLSKLKYTEGGERQEGSDIDFWGNYITALLEGKLADSDAEGIALNLPPEELALYLNEHAEDGLQEATYDRVITTYMRKKEHTGVKSELFSRFITMVDSLSPEIKQQLLRRAFNNPVIDAGDIDHLISDLSAYDMEKLSEIFRSNASLIPESLRNVMDKLGGSKTGRTVFDAISAHTALIDDIEIDDSVIRLFSDDHFKSFVSADYTEDLAQMLKGPRRKTPVPLKEIEQECRKSAIDRKFSDLIIEMLESAITTREDYLVLLTKISEIVTDFIDTGRYHEISDIYNTVYSHTLTGRYREDASSMLAYYFHSEQFIQAFLDSLKIWGRHNREGVMRLVNVQRRQLIDPLFRVLTDSEDASHRKFVLQLLSGLGNDVIPAAVKLLDDPRWHVVRNMIYLIREAGGSKHLKHIRPFLKNDNKKICSEALRTLAHFGTPDALSYMKLYLEGPDAEMRDLVVKLAGTYQYTSLLQPLLKLLERKRLLGPDLEFRKLVVKALADIGDPRALESLEAIVRSNPLMHRSAFETLKVEIYRSLQNYPAGSAAGLLEAGLGSKNEEIRTISEELSRGNAR